MSLYLQEVAPVMPVSAEKLAGSQELARIRKETEIERSWWGNELLLTIEDGLQAKAFGKLVEVPHGVSGRNFDLIRMPEMVYPDYGQVNLLKPEAYVMLEMAMDSLKGRFPKVIFPITALWRTADAQTQLRMMYSDWAMDVGESSHHSGAAFDVSMRSYWMREGEGRMRVNDSSASPVAFDRQVSEGLVEEFESMNSGGGINFVVENTWHNGMPVPAVLHVCVAPSDTVRI